jgi:hypothetical protein
MFANTLLVNEGHLVGFPKAQTNSSMKTQSLALDLGEGGQDFFANHQSNSQNTTNEDECRQTLPVC